MLCLHNSIRHDDPSLQRLLRAVEDAPSLTALILATWQVARILAVHLIEAVLAERARQPMPWPPCPACGAALRSKGCATRRMMSLCGPMQWQRRIGRCPQGCAIPQVAPLDEALGVPPHQRTSGALQSLGCALAVFVPFATAARLLGWSCGSVVSARAVWCWVQAAGHQATTYLQADVDAVARGDGPTPEPLPAEVTAVPLALGADGVMVPFRPVVDFYHAAQHLWQAAAGWLDGRTPQARRWCAWARHRLRHGTPEGILADVVDALDVEGLPETARETLRTVDAYLQRHREHINYVQYKELGLPLGSGMVESACKWLIQQRFKGVGMRWSEDGFNHLLHLRLAWLNGRFEALFGLTLSPYS